MYTGIPMPPNRVPHKHPVGAKFFITCRLFGAIPVYQIEQMQYERDLAIRRIENDNQPRNERMLRVRNEHKRYFAKFDAVLDKAKTGPMWLQQPEVAQVFVDKLHEMADNEMFYLIAYCIMHNHVHMLIDMNRQIEKLPPNTPITEENYIQVGKLMQTLKNDVATDACAKLQLEGYFWQKDNYDHYVRSEQEFQNIANYILHNPVNAGFVESWDQWKFSYINPDYFYLLNH